VEDTIPDDHIVQSIRAGGGDGGKGFSFALHRHPPFEFAEDHFAEHNIRLNLGSKPARL
jgi:hypothetical protein